MENSPQRRRGAEKTGPPIAHFGWQAKAPAPQESERLRTYVGQTLWSGNPALPGLFHGF